MLNTEILRVNDGVLCSANYSDGGQGPRLVKAFASGKVRARTPGDHAVAVPACDGVVGVREFQRLNRAEEQIAGRGARAARNHDS